MARHPKGSTPKLSEELIHSICQAIRRGAYIETAAALSGISKQTFYTWLRLAHEKDEGLERQLLDAVRQAQAESELEDLDVIKQAALEGAWAASAWRLERKFPKRWGKFRSADEAKSTASQADGLEKELEQISDDEWSEIERIAEDGAE